MPPRLLLSLLAALVVLLAVAAPASASSVAYIDGHNLWYSSPDGARKVQVTSGGTEDASWQVPSQGRDGKTVVVHRDTFEGGSKRPVLYLYGADGKLVTANVMPVYSGAIGGAVYPIGLDMDWNSNAVAYGYRTAASPARRSPRLLADVLRQPGRLPEQPAGRLGRVQPDLLRDPRRVLGLRRQHLRAARRPRGAVHELLPGLAEPRRPLPEPRRGLAGQQPGRGRVAQGRRRGGHHHRPARRHACPSDLVAGCDLQVAAHSGNLTFSPDGSQMAWRDDEGIKVAGVPNMAAGTDACTLSAPARVISTSGTQPSFGGADVAAVAGVGGGQPSGGPPAGGGKPARRRHEGAQGDSCPARRTRAAFAKGLTLKVNGRRRPAGSTPPRRSPPRSPARSAYAARRASRPHRRQAASPPRRTTVVARGNAKAKRAGTVKLRLKPTKAAKRAAKRMRKVVLTIKVSQAGAAGKAKVKLR